ncbi:SGNH/GDSL hydrolase family protein [Paenibacillus kandeliae]|uniref:SGNH/GDSL hydrolase family protein n=1 Tax=Paenibacillus kandeliae TaxID=3231269 RepID=UPI00345A1CC1
MHRKHTWIANALWGVVAIVIASGVIWLFNSQEQKQAFGDNSAVYNADAVPAVYQQPSADREQPTNLQQPADSSVMNGQNNNTTNSEQSNDANNNDSTQPTSIAGNHENSPKGSSSTSVPDGTGVSMIGDSVTVGVAPYLQEQLPNMTIDGKVSRQMSQADDVINNLVAAGKLGDHVIIELGTNGPFSSDQLRSVLQSLSSVKQVLLVTARVPKPWQDTVNDTMTQVGREFSNVQIVDWYGASAGKDQYFYNDGVHLKPDGSRYYTSLLVAALKK